MCITNIGQNEYYEIKFEIFNRILKNDIKECLHNKTTIIFGLSFVLFLIAKKRKLRIEI